MFMRAYRFSYQNKSAYVYFKRDYATNIFFMFARYFYVTTACGWMFLIFFASFVLDDLLESYSLK